MLPINKQILILLIASFAPLFSYSQPCVNGNGNIITRTLNLSSFDKISPLVGIQINVSKGNTQSVSVTGDSNILDSLVTEVIDGRLGVSFRTSVVNCYTNYALNINIVVPSLVAFDQLGNGTVIIGDFNNVLQLNVSNSGSGNMFIGAFKLATDFNVQLGGSGNITVTKDFIALKKYAVNLTGSGDFTACVVTAETCTVTLLGSGDAVVNAENQLNANIYGFGNIVYYGMPNITSFIVGSGQIIMGNPDNCITSSTDIAYQEEGSLTVYPNPAGEILHIGNLTAPTQMEVQNISGQMVFQGEVSSAQPIDIRALPKGMYFLRVGNKVGKFVKL